MKDFIEDRTLGTEQDFEDNDHKYHGSYGVEESYNGHSTSLKNTLSTIGGYQGCKSTVVKNSILEQESSFE